MSKDWTAPKLPEWDGKPENLPGLWQTFIYKGRAYIHEQLTGHEWIVDLATGKPSLPLAIRAFPGKTGSAVMDVLIKAKIVSPDELARVHETQDVEREVELLQKFVDLAKEQKDPEAWCHNCGITEKELEEVLEIVQRAILGLDIFEMAILAELLRIRRF